MIKHNAPDIFVMGVSAAAWPAPAFARMKATLWFEYLRRCIIKSDTPQRFGDHSLREPGAAGEPRITPTKLADSVAVYVLQANRFVAALQALVDNQQDILDVAPSTDDTNAALGAAFNDEPETHVFALAQTVAMASAAPSGDDSGAGVAAASGVDESKDESKAGSGGGGGGAGTSVAAADAKIAVDPFGRSPEDVLSVAAVATVMRESRWKNDHSTPLDNKVELVRCIVPRSVCRRFPVVTDCFVRGWWVQNRARVWLQRSSEIVSRGCPRLLDETTEAGELGLRLLRATPGELVCLGRLFARHMGNDARQRILVALQALVGGGDVVLRGRACVLLHLCNQVMRNPYVARLTRWLKRLEAGYAIEAMYVQAGQASKLQLVRDGVHANLRTAFLALDETRSAGDRLKARKASAVKFIKDEATATANALVPLVPALAVVVQRYTSPVGGAGLAQLRSRAPSLRKFGRAIAFMMPEAGRKALEAVLQRTRDALRHDGAITERAYAVLGQPLFENEALGTVLATAFSKAGRLNTSAEGWLSLSERGLAE